MMNLVCPNCKKDLSIPSSLVGKTEVCPDCGKSFQVPAMVGVKKIRIPKYHGSGFFAALIVITGSFVVLSSFSAENVVNVLLSLGFGFSLIALGIIIEFLRDIAIILQTPKG